ncbi:SGNH/GDSL hydrolase family protein [Sinisalibacter lacisalsi]|uniref:Hydrolase n=1 Tax=Sinisalibacter lacisalsi TaxID=1526570 RepID=A0ABQ1QAP8_9RHOB|nr:SGNH/GDSL hydrolase family protein [Sinisalibacter lacisalsi]GGD20276.1 hydrolase [Sinisalibacter lacisalsi]
MRKSLLVFGDSNSHGTPPIVTPGEYRRYESEARWPSVAAQRLGAAWEVSVQALPGRTTGIEDPVMGAHMNGQIGLRIALGSHGPIDLLAIMLGTNDMKARFAPTPEKIAAGIAGLVDLALSAEYQTRHGGFEVLVICPPRVLEQGPIAGEFIGATAVSEALPHVLKAHCAARGVHFFDAGKVISPSEQDGVHFDPDTHRALGENIAEFIAAL